MEKLEQQLILNENINYDYKNKNKNKNENEKVDYFTLARDETSGLSHSSAVCCTDRL